MLRCDNCSCEYEPGGGEEHDGQFHMAEHNHECPSCQVGTIIDDDYSESGEA